MLILFHGCLVDGALNVPIHADVVLEVQIRLEDRTIIWIARSSFVDGGLECRLLDSDTELLPDTYCLVKVARANECILVTVVSDAFLRRKIGGTILTGASMVRNRSRA